MAVGVAELQAPPEEEQLDPPRPPGRLDLGGREVEHDRPQADALHAVAVHLHALEALREEEGRDRREPEVVA